VDAYAGYATTSVTQSTENATTNGVGVGMSIEWSLTMGGVMFGQEYDFSGEVDSTFSTGNGTTISGAGAGLPNNAPAGDIPFWTGICAYPVALPSQTNKATLVTYWYSPTQPD
jgi:hypothetical protein